jgi:hypothetical protein
MSDKTKATVILPVAPSIETAARIDDRPIASETENPGVSEQVQSAGNYFP